MSVPLLILKNSQKMVAAVTVWPSRSRMYGAEMTKFAVVTSEAATVQDVLEPLGKLCCCGDPSGRHSPG